MRRRETGYRSLRAAGLGALAVLLLLLALAAAGGGEPEAVGAVSGMDFGGPVRQRYALFDRNMAVAAVDVPLASLYVVPREAGDLRRLAAGLARVTGRDAADILAWVEQGRGYVRLPGVLGPDAAARVRAAGLAGVHVAVSYRRYYPHGATAAHFIGFVADGRGMSGAEAVFDRELSGFGGRGGNVVLSLDFALQAMLEEGLSRISGPGGRAVAGLIDLSGGWLLAMADRPGFDPNHLWRCDVSQLDNDFLKSDPSLPAVDLSGLGEAAVLADGHGRAAVPLAVLAAFAGQVSGRRVVPRWKMVLWRPGRGFFAPAAATAPAVAPPEAGRVFAAAGRDRGVAWYVPAGGGDEPSFLLACYPADRPRYAIMLGARPGRTADLRDLASRVLRRAAASRPDLRPPAAGVLAAARRAGVTMFVGSDTGGRDKGPRRRAQARMPDLAGMSLRRALRVLQPLGARIMVRGSGRVVRQRPRPGAVVAEGETVTIGLGTAS